VHVFCGFQGIRQPEQIVLFRLLASAGTPEVIKFTGQLRADTQLAALFQQPLDVRIYLPCEAPLLQRGRQPAGDKEIFLCR